MKNQAFTKFEIKSLRPNTNQNILKPKQNTKLENIKLIFSPKQDASSKSNGVIFTNRNKILMTHTNTNSKSETLSFREGGNF